MHMLLLGKYNNSHNLDGSQNVLFSDFVIVFNLKSIQTSVVLMFFDIGTMHMNA